MTVYIYAPTPRRAWLNMMQARDNAACQKQVRR